MDSEQETPFDAGNDTAGEVTSAVADSTQDQPVEEQAPAQPQTAPTVDVESLVEQRLQDRLSGLYAQLQADLAKRDQSRDAQLLNRLQKRLGSKYAVYDELAKEQGWTPEQLKEQKTSALMKEFEAAVTETPSAPVPQMPQVPAARIVSHDEVDKYVRSKGLTPGVDVDLSKLAGRPSNDPNGIALVEALERGQGVPGFLKPTPERAAATQKKTAQAAQVAQVKSQFGGTATPSVAGGGTGSVAALEDEYNKLVHEKSVPQTERLQYQKRLAELEAELTRLGRL